MKTEQDTLKQELAKLKKEKAAYKAQCALFEKFISIARSPDEPEYIKVMLRKTVDIVAELTGAELGSLVMLDSDGVVVDSLLARGEISPELSTMLIGTVFRKGLAGWVFRQRQIGLVDDTQKDERWLNLPDQPYSVRSALAIPIISGEMLLGILTLMHSSPGHFKQEMADQMKMTANQIALVLENTYLFSKLNESFKSLGKAKKKIEAYSRALDRQLERGHQIQKDFLPRHLPRLSEWQIDAVLYPARRVSGDFYDIFTLPGDFTGLVIGDVCDKGVGSALFMALIRSLIRIFSGQAQLSRSPVDEQARTVGGRPGKKSTRRIDQYNFLRAVALTNDYLAQEHNEMSMFATLFFGVLNPASGELVYVNGGHEPVYIVGPKGIRLTLSATGPAVGMLPHVIFECKKIEMNDGDILFAYTDGVTEAVSPQKEFFTKQALISLLSQPSNDAPELMERIKAKLFAHIGNAAPEDDITILTVQRHTARMAGQA